MELRLRVWLSGSGAYKLEWYIVLWKLDILKGRRGTEVEVSQANQCRVCIREPNLKLSFIFEVCC